MDTACCAKLVRGYFNTWPSGEKTRFQQELKTLTSNVGKARLPQINTQAFENKLAAFRTWLQYDNRGNLIPPVTHPLQLVPECLQLRCPDFPESDQCSHAGAAIGPKAAHGGQLMSGTTGALKRGDGSFVHL